MLSTQQQKVANLNNISAVRIDSGGFAFTIDGKIIRQTPSLSREGAIKKGIGHIMARYRK